MFSRATKEFQIFFESDERITNYSSPGSDQRGLVFQRCDLEMRIDEPTFFKLILAQAFKIEPGRDRASKTSWPGALIPELFFNSYSWTRVFMSLCLSRACDFISMSLNLGQGLLGQALAIQY